MVSSSMAKRLGLLRSQIDINNSPVAGVRRTQDPERLEWLVECHPLPPLPPLGSFAARWFWSFEIIQGIMSGVYFGTVAAAEVKERRGSVL